MFKRLKKDNKKGFTLVELIVVLVILAILAALLIPALTGYIDKAKKKQIVAETRQAVMAAQTLADEEYAKSTTFTAGDLTTVTSITVNDIKTLAEVPGTINSVNVDADGKITSLEYSNGKTCTYNPSNAASNSDGDYDIN